MHVLPLIGEKPIDAITTADMIDVLTPIWSVKAETAGRIKQRMATIFDYAIARTWRTENPCNGAVKAALPNRSRQRRHFPALSYDEITEAMQVFSETTARPEVSKRKSDGLIFPSNRGRDAELSNMAFTMLLRRAGFEHITTHGTFRTWALEQTDTPWAVAEAALAHKLGGGEVSPYIRGDQLERRRTLMQGWSDFVTT